MGSQENKMIIILLFSYLECNQIWLNHLIDYHYFIYITTTLTIMSYGIKINRTSKHMLKCMKFEQKKICWYTLNVMKTIS